VDNVAFSRNFILGIFTKIYPHIPNLVDIGQTQRTLLHEVNKGCIVKNNYVCSKGCIYLIIYILLNIHSCVMNDCCT
jgi:hypothetical protein